MLKLYYNEFLNLNKTIELRITFIASLDFRSRRKIAESETLL